MELVASVESLVKLLRRLDAEALKQACIAMAKKRLVESDGVLRELSGDAVEIMCKPKGKTLMEIFAKEAIEVEMMSEISQVKETEE